MKILLICPAGMGKTYYIIQQMIQGKLSTRWCFIAPLRAIIEEVYQNLKLQGVHCLNVQSRKDVTRLKEYSIILSTSNLLSTSELNYLNDKEFVFVVDEFHLIYRWGDSFRDDLLQLYYFLLTQVEQFFLLTATLENPYLAQLIQDLEHEKKTLLKIDYGNLTIKKSQIRMLTYLKFDQTLKWRLLNCGVDLLRQDKVILFFVPFRNDVDLIASFFQRKGFVTLTAKGGEALAFTQELNRLKGQVQVIITTSVLSHGVNLPSIDHLFLLYPVKQRDFWVQMVYRAGRQGETFYLHHFDLELVSKKEIIKGFFWNLQLKIQIFINQVYREFY